VVNCAMSLRGVKAQILEHYGRLCWRCDFRSRYYCGFGYAVKDAKNAKMRESNVEGAWDQGGQEVD
jgi:hypothetical protein